jgi:hypothetical protein
VMPAHYKFFGITACLVASGHARPMFPATSIYRLAFVY